MEIVNTNDENSFDPKPRLKSSPIPIKFISFERLSENCIYCGEKYIKTLFCYMQKYCKTCLSRYINDITDNNIYLDVYIYTNDIECKEHEISRTKVPQSIQECCGNCVIESEKKCKLCGKSLYQGTVKNITETFKLCSDCYIISSELIESTLIKKQISILYLPWWDNDYYCVICDSMLTFTSYCQKYCTKCYLFYVGCRYCLMTNIIFGPTEQSQCRKCKRISPIINRSEYSGLDDFLLNNIIYNNIYNLEMVEVANIVKKISKYFEPLEILGHFLKKKNSIPFGWIPFSQFTDVKEIAKGGYGIIYKANWLSKNKTVILKRFENSINFGKYFLNELKALQHCIKPYHLNIIETHGVTKVPELGDYILVMEYASEGDLHKYLQNNFTEITWEQKLHILLQISKGLEDIHNEEFVHRDFHSGNILFDPDYLHTSGQWKTGDLGLSGLSQAVNSNSTNNEIYGVIPYIAPEVFKGFKFTKEADTYSLGMIMWELTTGCKPFDNFEHDHSLIYKILDGERPRITEDTPECYASLMKSCWDPDPKKRPSIKNIRSTFGRWNFINKNATEFNKAEAKRKRLIELKKIGPEFAEKRHSGAIYTSRPLSDLISKYSSIYSSSIISFDLNSTIQNFSTTLDSSLYISAELELDINTESLSSQNSSSTIQNFSTSLKKRRNKVETHDDSGKRIKTSFNL